MKPNYHNKGNNPHATHKTCAVCGLYLPIGPDGKFAKQHNSIDGYMNTCQKCRRKNSKRFQSQMKRFEVQTQEQQT